MNFAQRSINRFWRLSEFRLLCGCLLVVTAALVSVGMFANRVELAMQERASGLLGADALISSSRPLDSRLEDLATGMGLQTSQSISFLTMLLTDEDGQLSAVRAIDDLYPLRGELIVEGSNMPKLGSGEVWLADRLMAGLKLKIGDAVAIGSSDFNIVGSIVMEPGGEAGAFRMAPRVMMRIEDLPATGLISAASRARYRLLVAGEHQAIAGFGKDIKLLLEPHESWHTVDTRRSEVSAFTGRVSSYLKLVVMLAVILAIVAMALAAQGLWRYQTREMALLRCLGSTHRRNFYNQFVPVFLIGFFVSILGALVGVVIQVASAALVAKQTGFILPPAEILPAVLGCVFGLLALMAVLSPSMLGYRNVSVMQIFRAGTVQKGRNLRVGYAVIALLLLVITAVISKSVWLGGAVLIGIVLAGVLFFIVSNIVIRLLYGVLPVRSTSWFAAVKNLKSNIHRSAWLASAFGAGVFSIVLLSVVRGDLFAAWQQSLPELAPNLFVINIQAQDREPFDEFLSSRGITPELHYPISRGRLNSVNGNLFSADSFSDRRAKHRINHDFNLTELAELPESNQVVEGQWFKRGTPAWSMEVDTAHMLNIKPGDMLTVEINGEAISAPVENLRQVQWDSMQPNFYIIANSGMLDAIPRTYMTSMYVPAEQKSMSIDLARKFPAVTPIDISMILKRFRDLMQQGAMAINGVFIFALIGALLVLTSVLQGQRHVRRDEVGLLKSLGASSPWIYRSMLTEFALLGSVAGLVGSSMAIIVGWLSASWVFEFAFNPTWASIPVAMLLGAVVVAIGALLSLRPMLAASPLRLLSTG
ncbi:MAG: putative ABC transport system permease protein [Parasphingorhabdus sp.]|jgi:putative ABC transport system permease protein